MNARDLQRCAAKIVPSAGCWDWMGPTVDGYGVLSIGGRSGRQGYAARAIYEHQYGEIPQGRVLAHDCGNRWCVNPDHMKLVTRAAHVSRGSSPPAVNSRKRECIRGHVLEGKNLRMMPNGSRQCRECLRIRDRERRARDRDAR